MYPVVAELLRNSPDAESFVSCGLVLCLLGLVWRVMPRLADKGPDYIKQLSAHRLAMYELKHRAAGDRTPESGDSASDRT